MNSRQISIFFSLLLIALLNTNVNAQIATTIKDTIVKPKGVWTSENIVGFDLNEIAFVNWSAGGNSAISGLVKGQFTRKYVSHKSKWLNELITRYGISKQDGIELRKTDDQLQFNSTYGYRTDTTSNWYHTAKFNFNTQFTSGYAYPNTDLAISNPLSPAYTFLGVGAEYNNKSKNMQLYFSPLTMKNTLVLSRRLADQGAFGVDKAIYDAEGNMVRRGKTSRTELGILLTGAHKKEVYKNIVLENRLNLYTDYLNSFGNIDIEWQMQVDFVVNKYVKANISLHMIYDDDIKAKEEIAGEQVIVGPKLQIKQMLGIGLTYAF